MKKKNIGEEQMLGKDMFTETNIKHMKAFFSQNTLKNLSKLQVMKWSQKQRK